MTANDSGQTVRPDRQSSTDTQADTATDALWDSAQRVLEYIRQIDELTYVDAAEVADATGVSVQQAGTALGKLANHDDLAPWLTEWSKTRYGRTWRVAPEGSA
jgi:hypothetical protein